MQLGRAVKKNVSISQKGFENFFTFKVTREQFDIRIIKILVPA
jgi:hypothetical protein